MIQPSAGYATSHTGEVLNTDREMKKCLVDAYKLTDEDFLRMASQATPSWKDGSTAVTVLVLDDVIYCANVGDSKAFLCRRSASGGKLAFIPLTKEHSPSIVREGLGTRCLVEGLGTRAGHQMCSEHLSSCSLKRERE